MKQTLRLSFVLASLLTLQLANAQLTKLSNNTSLDGILINNKPFLESDIDNSFWTTNGTAAGTFKYTSKVVFDTSDNGSGGILGGKIYFAGTNGINGSELWVTDGTDAGTALIKNIAAGATSSTPDNFTLYNNQLFFTATTAATGEELWKTDGTATGTVMVKDINPGTGSSTLNSYGFFDYFVNNGVLYFVADDGTHGEELWKTDGSASGTMLVKDINAGPDGAINYGFGLAEFIGLGSTTFFSANDGTGLELWKTDGTATGTVKVKDISSDVSGSFPNSFVVMNNKVYFSAFTIADGEELWVTDGTSAGTNMVKDINAGVESSGPSLLNSIIFNNKLVFSADNGSGIELWITDGTATGTVLLKDIAAGATELNSFILPNNFFRTDLTFAFDHTPPFKGKAFFSVTTLERGTELWITNGTPAGTTLVKSIDPLTENGLNDGSYFYTANELFFSGGGDATGHELWKSDGTSVGTGLIKDINPGSTSSGITFDFVYNNHLYFSANDGDNTDENYDFFVLDQSVTLPLTLFTFSAAPQPSKAVKLEWNTTNEINSSYFEVERSADGVHFTNIYKGNTTGSNGLNQRYQYIDLQPAQMNQPILFYRLKLVDKDGSFQYSKILPVHFAFGALALSFSPNPVRDQLSVLMTTEDSKKATLRITDIAGRQVYLQNLSALQATRQQNINVAAWQKGMYTIQLITGNDIKTAKFIKQ